MYAILFFTNFSGGLSARSSIRRVIKQKPNEVIIHNIDRDTTRYIINELSEKKLKDLNFSLIS